MLLLILLLMILCFLDELIDNLVKKSGGVQSESIDKSLIVDVVGILLLY